MYGVRLAALLVIPLAMCGAACGTSEGSFYTCAQPEPGHLGPDGGPDPCHYADVDGGSNIDAGPCPASACVQRPDDFEGPTWLRFGPHEVPFGSDVDLTDCPDNAAHSFNGGIDLVAPTDCIPCTCGTSTGACELPSAFTASTTACNIPGGSSTSFDAPTP